jgi:hypothetical protein
VTNVSEAPLILHQDTSLGSFYAAVDTIEKVARVAVYTFLGHVRMENVSAISTDGNSLSTNPKSQFMDLLDSPLSREQRQKAEALLTDYKDVFSMTKNDVDTLIW